jgi:hypothetical protein
VTPTPGAFAALARSSPERWTTLRFTRRGSAVPPVRAWLRRPDLLRVEDLDGRLLQVVRRHPGPAGRDAPMYRDYTWVALLDPVELADGRDPDDGLPAPGTRIADVAEVEHAGRPAWEAVVAPTPGYAPRCSCCSLLRSRDVDERLVASGGPDTALDAYPSAARVRLDVGTGVCVLVEDLDGPTAGVRLDVGIEAVDEPMDDALFRGTG